MTTFDKIKLKTEIMALKAKLTYKEKKSEALEQIDSLQNQLEQSGDDMSEAFKKEAQDFLKSTKQALQEGKEQLEDSVDAFVSKMERDA